MTKSAIEQLLEIASLPGREIIERYPDRRFFGFTCSYWPEELVLAAGLEPLRLFPVNIRAMPPELPSFSCSLARGVLAELKGGLKKLAGLGLAQTCDTMQCLGSITKGVLSIPVLELVPPVLLAAPGAREYYETELEGLWQELLGLSGAESREEQTAAASELYGRMRQLVLQIDERRPRLPSPLVASLLRAGQLMPRQEYVTLLSEAIPALAGYEDGGTGRIGILLSGPVLEKDSLYEMIEELGGRVLVDDTCTGTRHYAEGDRAETGTGGAGSVSQLLAQVARRHLTMPICPCRHRRLEERVEYLKERAQAGGVKGAILIVRKYCDPHAFDAIPVAKGLQQQGLKTLVLELEGAEVGGQERTRLQAFLESLG